MAVNCISLNPEKLLPSVQNLGLVADPRRPWEQDIALEDIEKGKEQWLGARRNNDLLGADRNAKSLCIEQCDGLDSSINLSLLVTEF